MPSGETRDLVGLVDPLVGTDSHFGFSTGNCLPLAAAPFGMTAWSPQTAEGSWFFDKRSRKLQGIRATHQPSPWIGDYGHFTVMAQTGPLSTSPQRRSSAFRSEDSTVKPHYLAFELIRYRTRIELSPTKRCASMRITFPAGESGRVLIEPSAGASWTLIDPACDAAAGYTRGNSGGCPDSFACYYFFRFSRPISGYGAFAGDETHPGAKELEAVRAGAYLEFEGGGEIQLSIGTSFISIDQAAANLAREIGNAGFDETVERAQRVWNENLGRVRIDDDDRQAVSTFYTCLYRTQLFPRIWHEEAADGSPMHYSPFDGKLHAGVFYSDNGFWDTYRTMYPLLALLDPSLLAEILEGWTNAYKEGGWFPQWASPGYRACMVGTHIDAVMADAAVRGVTGFDLPTAFEGLLKHAYQPGDDLGSYGRLGIEEYEALGYVPADKMVASVARTLDYAYDDFCIAQIAKLLGREEEAQKLLVRAGSYRRLYDPSVGFMRGKNADGSWLEPFDPFLWGGPFVEGGPWQGSWGVQHATAGLIELMGGSEAFVRKLELMLTTEPGFSVGAYGFEIHEMTEMAVAGFGQYAHSNQPVHHVLYLFAAAGQPWKTQRWVREVMDRLYTAQSFPGDEDNGEMSAWYVLSALGIFPSCPGHPSFTFGSPRFKSVAVKPFDRPEMHFEALENGSGRPYVRSVIVNGKPWDRLWIDHATLVSGASLIFSMDEAPLTMPVTDSDLLPFSM